ncbi:DeoR/GlpR family DNA-binding transcription regulator [Pseudoduganella namucuonensis]|uniref:Transcriptional regulator, DeoR family n=1 Tax=Pseudoduganella namucuonensis TaxID=1035707 RepID=A0A1I7F2C8_9BURK|nr:DeoR/GlpR family DNA-binding transcription regulator [Pseudoduganella namucuonensis]SFU30254.1 transcriptional regulator, DeoR family [Pseudoduganella namucuonensis]
MLTRQRKELLLKILREDGQIVARTLSEQLGLSEDTIRRDLRDLAREGLLERVHGGALPASPAIGNFAERQAISADHKPALGRAAAAMVQAGQVVFVDGGTTAVQVARHLPRDLRATVVTHSPSVAVELVEHPTVEVILIGGRLFKHSIVSVGAAALEAIAQIRTDIYFMGVCSVHPEAGVTTGDYEEACVKRAIGAASQRTIVLASPEKLDTASPFQTVPLARVGGIIANAGVDEALLAPYRAMGIAITIAT